DAAVEIAVEGEVADATAIGSADGLFQFGDDLHRPHFRRARKSACGEGRAHQIVGSLVVAEASFHVGDDVHDVTVALDDHEVFDLHAAIVANAAQIVSRQIDQHDV